MLLDAELERYSRQLLLPAVDLLGQTRLKNAHVSLVGIGGLGCTVATLLASSGVGHLRLIDPDRVELSNLQRQVLYRETDIGQYKALAALAHLLQLNSHVQYSARSERLDADNMAGLLAGSDLILDCSDNLATRELINRHCQQQSINLIQGSALQRHGEVLDLPLASAKVGCYQCVYPPHPRQHQPSCREAGVWAPLLAIVGGLQAQLALQRLLDSAQSASSLYRYDGHLVQFKRFVVHPDPDCDCGSTRSQALEARH
ncbi:HesA/MoeB/ThiF family protein [Reinekea sp.]|jgi:adenylyltransferase/sulfurtransferase|uniref:HesA/MoeB/ThiF family protein n=1 Tax=Reinekea sp. TaxID=1970455 RepID=UPI002A7F4A94|nr:HesA/MoeB/ThiF family protein [Reinekea sp.]